MSPMNLASACTSDATNGWDVLALAIIFGGFAFLWWPLLRD